MLESIILSQRQRIMPLEEGFVERDTVIYVLNCFKVTAS